MDVNEEKYYIEIKQQYNRKKLKFDFHVPFVYQKIRSEDNINNYHTISNHLFIQPGAYIEYKAFKKIKLRGSFNYTKNFETDNANIGYILRNYNYIDRGSADIDLENNTLTVKHVNGTFTVNEAEGIKEITLISQNIPEAETEYWYAVNAYDDEKETNELKRNVFVLKSSYLAETEKQFIQQLSL